MQKFCSDHFRKPNAIYTSSAQISKKSISLHHPIENKLYFVQRYEQLPATKLSTYTKTEPMKSKDLFLTHSYDKLTKAIHAIPEELAKDIYALSFFYYAEEDDPRFPSIEVSYNTTEQYKKETANASDETEAQWNYAFWLQEAIEKIGGAADELLRKWFKETPYYYSEAENEAAEEDDELFDKLLEQGGNFETEFTEGIISLTRKLFKENVTEKKFGKDIPIIIHELEYYDQPIAWTQKANKPGLIEPFIAAYESGKL